VAIGTAKEERSENGIYCRVNVAPASFNARTTRVPLGRRPHQGRLAERCVSWGWRPARAAPSRSAFPERGGQHEDGFPAFIVAFASAPASNNSFTIAALPFVHACATAARHSGSQRSHSRPPHEQCNGLGIIVIRSPVQRGSPVDLGGVHVDACPEEACGR